MIADLDTQLAALSALRTQLVGAGAMMQAALARGQDIAQEVSQLRQTLLAEDTAPLEANTRMSVADVLRERRNRQEAGAARIIALRQEVAALIYDIVAQLVGRAQ